MPFPITKKIPARTEVWTVLWIQKAWVPYTETFRQIRDGTKNKLDRCWWCHTRFEDNEMMGLLCLKDAGNKVVCQTCADEISQRGEG